MSFDRPPVYACTVPAWPVAGPAVAGELARLPQQEWPATWEWIDRLEDLRDQLEAQRG